ncbi:MAG: hypothetical protein Q7V01_10385 [Vicinamibacterales bacterium]|nr:hypothetical protein [Vicinamibacterales bacterium]
MERLCPDGPDGVYERGAGRDPPPGIPDAPGELYERGGDDRGADVRGALSVSPPRGVPCGNPDRGRAVSLRGIPDAPGELYDRGADVRGALSVSPPRGAPCGNPDRGRAVSFPRGSPVPLRDPERSG